MNKKDPNNAGAEVLDVVKLLPNEIINLLAKEYKREQDLKLNLRRLKVLMANTYVSKLIH